MDEVRVEWGSGIAGHVADSGEPVNIPDAYEVTTIHIFIAIYLLPYVICYRNFLENPGIIING